MSKRKNYNKEFNSFIEKSLTNIPEFFGGELSEKRKSISKQEQFLIHNLDLIGNTLQNARIQVASFENCKFIDYDFHNITFSYVTFLNCTFDNCKFSSLIFYYTNFVDCYLSETDILDTRLRYTEFNVVKFNKCDLLVVEFNGGTYNDLLFEDCTMNTANWTIMLRDANIKVLYSTVYDCQFIYCNLEKFSFSECFFRRNIFVQSIISNDTFIKNKDTLNDNQNLNIIDVQSILKSNLNSDSLQIFGFKGHNPKGYIEDLISEIKFQSVFISYSFNDKIFARIFNDLLRRFGVNTFLWERDAPGGRRLKKIMAENIQNHDRLLFIASKHSLKSEACHYELQEAREKQNKEWKDIYYPIHIDNYLFEVRKEDIPRKYREDFWENIEEVKEFNSKDFTQFKTEEDFKSPEFEEAVKQLIKDLKL